MSMMASNYDRNNIQVSHNGIDLCWRVSPYFISWRNEWEGKGWDREDSRWEELREGRGKYVHGISVDKGVDFRYLKIGSIVNSVRSCRVYKYKAYCTKHETLTIS